MNSNINNQNFKFNNLNVNYSNYQGSSKAAETSSVANNKQTTQTLTQIIDNLKTGKTSANQALTQLKDMGVLNETSVKTTAQQTKIEFASSYKSYSVTTNQVIEYEPIEPFIPCPGTPVTPTPSPTIDITPVDSYQYIDLNKNLKELTKDFIEGKQTVESFLKRLDNAECKVISNTTEGKDTVVKFEKFGIEYTATCNTVLEQKSNDDYRTNLSYQEQTKLYNVVSDEINVENNNVLTQNVVDNYNIGSYDQEQLKFYNNISDELKVENSEVLTKNYVDEYITSSYDPEQLKSYEGVSDGIISKYFKEALVSEKDGVISYSLKYGYKFEEFETACKIEARNTTLQGYKDNILNSLPSNVRNNPALLEKYTNLLNMLVDSKYGGYTAEFTQTDIKAELNKMIELGALEQLDKYQENSDKAMEELAAFTGEYLSSLGENDVISNKSYIDYLSSKGIEVGTITFHESGFSSFLAGAIASVTGETFDEVAAKLETRDGYAVDLFVQPSNARPIGNYGMTGNNPYAQMTNATGSSALHWYQNVSSGDKALQYTLAGMGTVASSTGIGNSLIEASSYLSDTLTLSQFLVEGDERYGQDFIDTYGKYLANLKTMDISTVALCRYIFSTTTNQADRLFQNIENQSYDYTLRNMSSSSYGAGRNYNLRQMAVSNSNIVISQGTIANLNFEDTANQSFSSLIYTLSQCLVSARISGNKYGTAQKDYIAPQNVWLGTSQNGKYWIIHYTQNGQERSYKIGNKNDTIWGNNISEAHAWQKWYSEVAEEKQRIQNKQKTSYSEQLGICISKYKDIGYYVNNDFVATQYIQRSLSTYSGGYSITQNLTFYNSDACGDQEKIGTTFNELYYLRTFYYGCEGHVSNGTGLNTEGNKYWTVDDVITNYKDGKISFDQLKIELKAKNISYKTSKSEVTTKIDYIYGYKDGVGYTGNPEDVSVKTLTTYRQNITFSVNGHKYSLGTRGYQDTVPTYSVEELSSSASKKLIDKYFDSINSVDEYPTEATLKCGMDYNDFLTEQLNVDIAKYNLPKSLVEKYFDVEYKNSVNGVSADGVASVGGAGGAGGVGKCSLKAGVNYQDFKAEIAYNERLSKVDEVITSSFLASFLQQYQPYGSNLDSYREAFVKMLDTMRDSDVMYSVEQLSQQFALYIIEDMKETGLQSADPADKLILAHNIRIANVENVLNSDDLKRTLTILGLDTSDMNQYRDALHAMILGLRNCEAIESTEDLVKDFSLFIMGGGLDAVEEGKQETKGILEKLFSEYFTNLTVGDKITVSNLKEFLIQQQYKKNIDNGQSQQDALSNANALADALISYENPENSIVLKALADKIANTLGTQNSEEILSNLISTGLDVVDSTTTSSASGARKARASYPGPVAGVPGCVPQWCCQEISIDPEIPNITFDKYYEYTNQAETWYIGVIKIGVDEIPGIAQIDAVIDEIAQINYAIRHPEEYAKSWTEAHWGWFENHQGLAIASGLTMATIFNVAQFFETGLVAKGLEYLGKAGKLGLAMFAQMLVPTGKTMEFVEGFLKFAEWGSKHAGDIDKVLGYLSSWLQKEPPTGQTEINNSTDTYDSTTTFNIGDDEFTYSFSSGTITDGYGSTIHGTCNQDGSYTYNYINSSGDYIIMTVKSDYTVEYVNTSTGEHTTNGIPALPVFDQFGTGYDVSGSVSGGEFGGNGDGSGNTGMTFTEQHTVTDGQGNAVPGVQNSDGSWTFNYVDGNGNHITLTINPDGTADYKNNSTGYEAKIDGNGKYTDNQGNSGEVRTGGGMDYLESENNSFDVPWIEPPTITTVKQEPINFIEAIENYINPDGSIDTDSLIESWDAAGFNHYHYEGDAAQRIFEDLQNGATIDEAIANEAEYESFLEQWDKDGDGEVDFNDIWDLDGDGCVSIDEMMHDFGSAEWWERVEAEWEASERERDDFDS